MARRRRARDVETSPPLSNDFGSSALNNLDASPLDELLEPLPSLPSDLLSPLDNLLGEALPFDRRAFSFGEVDGRAVNEVGPGRKVLSPEMSPRVARHDVERASICARRSSRREVLFALNKQRKRGGGGKRRYTSRSRIGC